ncbi:hypothetical protein, partial [Herbiconiux daphne]
MKYLDEQGQFSTVGAAGPITAPTVDNLSGAGVTGKALMKTATPAAALTALGITPQTKPADVAVGADAAALVTAVNALAAA